MKENTEDESTLEYDGETACAEAMVSQKIKENDTITIKGNPPKWTVDGCGCICIILATCWGICWIIEAYGRYVLTK